MLDLLYLLVIEICLMYLIWIPAQVPNQSTGVDTQTSDQSHSGTEPPQASEKNQVERERSRKQSSTPPTRKDRPKKKRVELVVVQFIYRLFIIQVPKTALSLTARNACVCFFRDGIPQPSRSVTIHSHCASRIHQTAPIHGVSKEARPGLLFG